MTLEGRLDSTWAEHVRHELSDVIASGQHHIRINLAGVKYISSAGLGVLANAYREVRELDGTFAMDDVGESVQNVLAITGLTFLVDGGPPVAAARASNQAAEVRRIENAGYILDVYAEPARPVEAALMGEPPQAGRAPTASSLHHLRADPNRMALGIGALGVNAEDCLARLGDFIALDGCAAVQTSDGAPLPDYVQASGTMVPGIHVLYGIDVQGELTGACRFEAQAEAGPVKLSALARGLLEATGSDELAIVLIAEAAGLVGASLRQSPAAQESRYGNYSVPEIREWLSYTPEPEYVRSLALVAGVISTRPGSAMSAQLRAIDGEADLQGHLHAAVFAYRALKRGRLKLYDAVNQCFGSGQAMAVLHLLSDSRAIAGAGESEFLRGFCWTGPVRSKG